MSSKLFKNTALYSIGNMSQKGLSFLLVFLYTNYLSPEDIGVINSIQVFSAIYAIFLSFGLERSLYRLYHDYNSEFQKKRFLGTVNVSILIISIIVIGFTIVLRSHFGSLFKGINFYPFIVLGILDAFFTVLTIVPKLLFQVKDRPIPYILLTLGQSLAGVFCICAFLYSGYRSAEVVLLGGIIAYVILFPVNLFVMYKNMFFVLDKKILLKTLRYSIPLLPSLLSSWIINMSDRLFLEHYYSLKDVGLYSVAYKMGQVVQLFSTAILMAYNPLFFSLANKENPDETKILSLHNTNIKILMFLCFSITLLSNDFIAIVLSKEYVTITHIVPIVVFGYFFIQMTGLQNLSFHQTKKTVLLMFISIGAAIVNIALNYLLIPKWGMNGAAYATLATQFAFFAISYLLSTKVYLLRIDFKTLTPLLFSGVIVIYLSFTFFDTGWFSLTIKMIFLLFIVLAMFPRHLIPIFRKI